MFEEYQKLKFVTAVAFAVAATAAAMKAGLSQTGSASVGFYCGLFFAGKMPDPVNKQFRTHVQEYMNDRPELSVLMSKIVVAGFGVTLLGAMLSGAIFGAVLGMLSILEIGRLMQK